MAAKNQTICYPSQAMQVPVGDHTSKPMCTKCNAKDPHSNMSNCVSHFSKNSSTNYAPCSAYCNSSPNTVCAVKQSYCNIGKENIKNHADVGAHPSIACTAKDEFIFRNWTARYWNSLIDKLDTAEIVGLVNKQGSVIDPAHVTADPQNMPHPAGSLVTGVKYNEVVKLLNNFQAGLGQVQGAAQVGCEAATVIRGAHAAALVSGYNSAKFRGTVCDICNASRQTNPTCDCNCPCPCACNCGCDCPCECYCDCQCDCSCSCSRGG